jgi:hypothetical protein
MILHGMKYKRKNIYFFFVHEFTCSFPHCKNAIKSIHELNSAQTPPPTSWHTSQNLRPEQGYASMRADQPEVILKISFEVETLLRELRTITYVMTTEKLSVTIDKGQKSEHFCKITNPPGHNS